MLSNLTTNTTEVTEDSNHYIYTLYIFAFFTWGASAQKLYKLVYTTSKGFLNIFVILPLITLITATLYIILDLERAFSGGFTDEQALMVSIAQYCLDFPSSVCLQLALWIRLHILLKAESKLGSFPILSQVVKILLFVPLTWCVCTIMGILGLFYKEYETISVDIVGLYNVLTGVYDILLHSIFLYLFLNRIPSVRNLKAWRRMLTSLVVIVSFNSVGLAFGGAYSFYDPLAGYVIIYATWLVEVFVFLLLNDVVGTMLKSSKKSQTHTISLNNTKTAE